MQTYFYISLLILLLYLIFVLVSMPKSRKYSEFTKDELILGRILMAEELIGLSRSNFKQIDLLFRSAWNDFMIDKFAYDGATFVKERHADSLFEVAAFIHDWRNANGYVGSKIDDELFSVMAVLNYPPEYFKYRARWTFFTWLNWLRHKYIKKDLRDDLPTNLFILKK